MNWTIAIIMMIFMSTFFVRAETVSLKGIVKNSSGTAGIPGVKVSLTKLSKLSTTTGTDGTFTLTGNTSIKNLQNGLNEPIQFMIKGNVIVFAPTSQGVIGSLNIFSSDGKTISSVQLHDLSSGTQTISLPRLASGINIMKLSIGTESFTRTLICVGNGLFLKNEQTNLKSAGKLVLAKQLTSTAIDTLKVEKDRYVAKKVPFQKYTQENIAISLDTNDGGNPGKCTREALQAVADKYIEAQKAGDPSKMPLSDNVTYIENFKTITLDKSICKTPLPIDFFRHFIDVDSCWTFTEVISATNKTPFVFITRLKIENSKVAVVNALVTNDTDWAFDANNYLKYSKKEDWSVLPAAQQSTRAKLIAGGDAYLDIFNDKTTIVPWGRPCSRLEGGAYTNPNNSANMSCSVYIPAQKVNITNRSYVVDLDLGTVDIFCRFGGSSGMPDSHMFRLIDGKIRWVHTLSVCRPEKCPTP